MPTYDPFEQRLAVRVVYDGVAYAGKTTNLLQLCTLFAAQKSSAVYTPGELNGRTLYFDWMQISAGLVCGFPLLCQVVSVPGQVALTPRRKHLLTTADVVVYVCESHPSGVDAARRGLAVYDEVARDRGSPIPLVVQANKQDRVDALDGAALVRALGREGAPVVEGIAKDGVGVVDTFVTAIRTIARAIQARSEKDVLRVHVRRAETAAEVLRRLSAEQLDAEAAAEMLLEEAAIAFALDGARVAAASNESALASARAAADEIARLDFAARKRKSRRRMQPPSFPAADVPTGFIWPAHTGRAIVKSLALAGAEEPSIDDDGVLALVTQGRVVRTSLRARFADGEAARQALVRAARECTQLDRLLVPETVLVAQPSRDGACWIWSVRLDLPSVARALEKGGATQELVTSYGIALVEAMRAAFRHGFAVDLSPASFAAQQGTMRYVGEIVQEPPDPTKMSAAIASAADRVERAGLDLRSFLDVVGRELERKLTAEERARVSLAVVA